MNDEREQHAPKPTSQHYLLAVAFFSGMAVMGVEICAGRLMAPFFGTSLLIWSVIIGSIMIALTLGYYLGGILAEKHPRMSFLGTLLFFTSLFMIFLPYIAQPVMEVTLGRFAQATSTGGSKGNSAIIVALTVCALIISAPVVFLGMTSPFLIRLDSLRSSAVGRISGKIFAVSTLGSILGTFLPALLLIPLVGTRLSFFLFGIVLLGITMWSIERERLFFWSMGLAAVALALVMGIYGWGTGHNRSLLQERETNYQRVRVYRVPTSSKTREEAKTAVALLTDAGLGVQSWWVEGQRSTDSWQDAFALIPRAYDVSSNGATPKRLLILGLGGGCAPYIISQFYPDIVTDGVEIDGGLIDVARPYFPFASIKNLQVHISDARFFLHSSRVNYDIVVVDAFRPPHIPFHVATAEFFAQVKQHLAENGIMAMNVGSRGEMRVFKGIANTVASVFPHVYFSQYYSPDEGTVLFSSRLLIASVKDLHLDKADVEGNVFSVPDPEWRGVFETMRDRSGFDASQTSFFRRVGFDPNAPFFLDDRSSLEMISEREFLGLVMGR